MIAYDNGPEHEFEAAHGLPQALPGDERVVWQGSPEWRLIARDAMHTRMLSIYFAILIAWRGVTVLSNGGSGVDAVIAMSWLLPLAVIAIAALTVMGFLIARTSVYTITDKRVVMRIGVVLSITFNLPFSKISSAAVRAKADGSGDITLALVDTDHIAYVHLWPHARPWKVARTEPMLRGLSNVKTVAQLLSSALAEVELPVRPARVAAQATTPLVVPAHRPAADISRPASEPGRQAIAA